ncbi:MAG: HAD-IA family hydrolase [Ignavibacteriaceae bacterium]|nr:HAD-IA family hydrolase [Ignavibacteriaceae bacterium]
MLNNIKLAVFDLDGTLLQSRDTIWFASVKTFEHLGMKVDFPLHELEKRIGAHFQDIFDELGISVPDIEEFIEIYKGYYMQYMDKTVYYPGAKETVRALRDQGIKTAILTTKAQSQVTRIMEYLGDSDLFEVIMGRRPGMKIKPDAEPLVYIANELNVPLSETVMIGDSEFDINCGKNAGAATIAVSYGYRSIEIIKDAAPDYICDTAPQILALFNHR